MCQMSVVLEKDGQQEKIMDNVTKLEVVGNGVTIATLFEQPQELADTVVKSIDFMDNLVVLVPAM